MEIDKIDGTTSPGRKRELPFSQENLEPCAIRRRVEPGPDSINEEVRHQYHAFNRKQVKDSIPFPDGVELLLWRPCDKDDDPDYSYVGGGKECYENLVINDGHGDLYEESYHCYSSYESDKAYQPFFLRLLEESGDLLDLELKSWEIREKDFQKMDLKLVDKSISDAYAVMFFCSEIDIFCEKFVEYWKRAVVERETNANLLQDVFKMKDPDPSFLLFKYQRIFNAIYNKWDPSKPVDEVRKCIWKLFWEDVPLLDDLYFGFVGRKMALAKKLGIIKDDD